MIQDFTIEELGLFITLVAGSVGACAVLILRATANSRCDKINVCCITCHRDVLPPEAITEVTTEP